MSISDQIDNIEGKLNWHWRDSMKIVRFSISMRAQAWC